MRCKTALRIRRAARLVAVSGLLAAGPAAWAIDIDYIQPAALDQPRINAYVRFDDPANPGQPLGDPLTFEGVFNIEAFFDTGASGILLSRDPVNQSGTAYYLGIDPSTYNGQEVTFTDTGVVGGDLFNVSNPLHFGLASYNPEVLLDDLSTYPTVYNQTFGPVRTQLGPVGGSVDPVMQYLLGDLDIIGVPLMQGKVVVMDPKPVDTFADTMRTYVYNPGTPYNAAQAAIDPGIPTTSHHIRLSYGNFDRYSITLPTGAPGPTTNGNPFIGPDPVRAHDGIVQDNPPPPIKISYGVDPITGQPKTTTGSFLLDTGAAASMISSNLAAALGITYDPASVGTDTPVLMYDGAPLPDQFMLSIGGIGGITKKAGFFLDSMLLYTQEGNPANDNDPNHIRFLHAPVLVNDITLADPSGDPAKALTIDGLLGMNFFVASASVTETGGSFPDIGNLTFGRFNWIVFDQPNGILGLDVKSDVSAQNSVIWLGSIYGDRSEWDNGLSANFIGGLTFTPFMDGDNVQFLDYPLGVGLQIEADPNVYVTEAVSPASMLFDVSLHDWVIQGFPITGLGGLTKRGTATVSFFNSNTYRGTTSIEAGKLIFAAPQNIGPVEVHAGGQLEMQTSQVFKSLSISGGTATITPGGAKLLEVEDVNVTSGELDLADNKMIVHGGDLTAVNAQVKSGYHAGAWDGPGIVTSSATNVTTLGVAQEGTDVVVKFTYIGDTNLDGVVNGSDFANMKTGYSLQGTLGRPVAFSDGDLNYDGIINGSDFAMAKTAYSLQGAPLSNVAVPEPGMMAMLLLAGAGLAARRRRLPVA